MLKIGITGGIGSGKSTLCALLAARGAAVYDSDSRAKQIMVENADVRRRIVEVFGAESYDAEGLDRRHLARQAFASPEKLKALDAIVHPAVKEDFRLWAAAAEGDYVVLESAILFESGFDAEVDKTVAVLAPAALRTERAAKRDGADAQTIERRIAAQMSDEELSSRADFCLVNILRSDLEAEAERLDKMFRLCSR